MSKGVRNVFGIIALVFSGFFLYGLNLVAFVNQPAWLIKTIVLAVFGIPAIVFLLIGVFCHGFDKFRRDLGIVLLSAAGMTALVVLSFICMLASPDIAKSFPPDMLQMFSAVLSGVACLSLYIVLGLGLLFTLRKRT
jgi:hypothetical protein